MDRQKQIEMICDEVKELLVAKNKAYGDAALSPLNVFSNLSAREGIMVRLDDKLKRIQNKGLNSDTEDTLLDVIGYLVLLRVSMMDAQPKENPLIDWA
jgi:hypothetical protein